MNRSAFLKNLIGLFGISALPPEMVKQYRKIYLLQSFVRGFRFYEGPKIINEINKSGLLELVREPDNQYDPCAIALHFNGKKIGFLPMESNEMLSILMDAELIALQAEITYIETQAADWEKIHIAVYALKETESIKDWDKVEPYTLLETPRYHTLKSKNDTYTRLYYDLDEEVVDNFYETLVKNSSADKVNGLIEHIFTDTAEMDEVARQSKLIINKKRVPQSFSVEDLEQTINQASLTIEEFFGEDGYVVANINKIATIPDKILTFEKISDKYGRYFYEVIFKSI